MFVELKHAPTTSAIARQHIEDLEAHLVERNWSLGQINSENRGLDSRYYLKDEMSKSTHYDNIPPHTTHHTPNRTYQQHTTYILSVVLVQALADYKQVMFVIMKPPNENSKSEVLTLLGESGDYQC